MNISVEYKDRTGVISNRTYNITRLAFAKHLAIAGQGYSPRPQKLLRTIGMFFHYSKYLQRQPFYNDQFSQPPIELSDPTEKGQFSNLAGKAIADYLSKRIDGSILTVNYEAGMRLRNMPLNVGRPDLLAYSQNSMFAIEAKGYSGGSGNMTTHKTQSTTGGIPVNFTVACVSHNLYNNVQCKYHDPYNDNIPYDLEGLTELSRKYYSGLAGFLNEKYFKYEKTEINEESFYAIELSFRKFEKLFMDEYPFPPFHFFELFDFYRPQIILPANIRELAENGISKNMKPFELSKENNTYIDNDRIGLRIRR
jgi:hypothetical protein